ncbi:glycoside hydrolase family 5 protein [Clostridium sp. MSJ-4]|uniref:Glycoside hydrolase family 5 protein n=1 Tax=Clostridium simiarum TaxID=2841506 RepID=A0ABS6EZH8_9CLOT|nr:glycoside hydrolase family 5 protein [Clostridium simiarum]MBU5591657.1 glycoside hydrolase family 5 protein [Clostridium simiarum]
MIKKPRMIFLAIFIIFTTLVAMQFIKIKRPKRQLVKMNRGINIGNALEAPKDFPWDVTLINKYFDDIKAVGFDTVRIPVRFSDYTKDDKNYTIDQEFFQKIDGHIQYALDKGLIVVLDFHHFTQMMEEPEEQEEKFLRIWEQIAYRYRKYPKELVFELLNEPMGNLSPQLLNEYIKKCVKVIRKTNYKRTLIVGPCNYYQIDYLEQLKIPRDNNIMVSFHYYEPNDFCFQGNIYHKGFENLHNITWKGTEEQLRYLEERFNKVEKWANKNQVPIFLGEFGVTKEAPRSSREFWIKAVREEAEKRNFAWAYWELASGFGIYDAKNESWDEIMLKSLIQER